MKKASLLLFLLLCTPLVLAQTAPENYNEFSSLELAFKVQSGVDLTITETPQKVGYVQADLSFFPKDNPLQTVKHMNVQAQPSAKTSTQEEFVSYKWTNPSIEALAYSVDAVIETKNQPVRLKRVVSFPIAAVDPSALEFTKATEFIDLNAEIEQRAYDIIGGETDLYKAVFKLADWTKTNINYDLNTLTAEAVQKSSWVMKNRNGVCDELTNLFISFVRSVGIPARFVSGMVYTNLDYSWGPHGWAEVYFPDYGWVPFDVTFGQYGWLDPSHITLKYSDDSGSPSAEYSWQATGVKVQVKALQPSVSLISTGGSVLSPLTISVSPMRERVGFGSLVPLLITVTNNEDYYVSTSLVVRKAPELLEDNVKELLLLPGETKTVGWLISIPSDLDQQYIYTGAIEVASSFNDVATSKIVYAAEYPVMKENEAQRVLFNLEQREEKIALSTLKVSCSTSQDLYYKNETALVDCSIKNTDSSTAQVNVCLRADCQEIALNSGEQKQVQFDVALQTSGRIPITAETIDGVASAYVAINLVALPEIYVSDVEPDEVNYKDEVHMSFNINSDSEVKNAKLSFVFGDTDLASFKGSRTITIDTDGKSLYIQGIKFTATFTDEKGEQHIQKIAVPIKVNDVPWYAKFAKWVRNIF